RPPAPFGACARRPEQVPLDGAHGPLVWADGPPQLTFGQPYHPWPEGVSQPCETHLGRGELYLGFHQARAHQDHRWETSFNGLAAKGSTSSAAFAVSWRSAAATSRSDRESCSRGQGAIA